MESLRPVAPTAAQHTVGVLALLCGLTCIPHTLGLVLLMHCWAPDQTHL